ncbi:ComEC family competence protein [Luteitalea pratensis]|uniref:ComEC family competence protein n=1 Tax=Luteitalea pratensis TaxID=1855912 RepID=A0A143PG82_LUTPR|nr:MBL fold metallo-hydrolase [Luteitalea pratensis]AMY07545.1 ComEC family competence protein [Luteitalea pratensis]
MRMLFSLFGIVLTTAVASAQPSLDIYYLDVEGGAATLIVTPARESVLVDAGWPGNGGRDVDRIQAAMKAAGITRIDHLIVTHYHTDHVGGVPPLLAKVPVGTVYDHGLMSPPHDPDYASNYEAYVKAVPQRKGLAAGDAIGLKPSADGTPVSLSVVAAHGKVLSRASAPRNARCSSVPAKPADTSDNARSVAFVLTYGAFDFFDAGDLTWNTEAELVCPNVNVPAVEVYQVTHHGLDASNHPLLLEALAPTVAVMNNGAKKGGSAATVKTLKSLPSLKALYQLHRNVATGPDDNTTPDLVANPDESPDAGHMVSVHAKKDGSFEVANHRTGEKRSFASAR